MHSVNSVLGEYTAAVLRAALVNVFCFYFTFSNEQIKSGSFSARKHGDTASGYRLHYMVSYTSAHSYTNV